MIKLIMYTLLFIFIRVLFGRFRNAHIQKISSVYAHFSFCICAFTQGKMHIYGSILYMCIFVFRKCTFLTISGRARILYHIPNLNNQLLGIWLLSLASHSIYHTNNSRLSACLHLLLKITLCIIHVLQSPGHMRHLRDIHCIPWSDLGVRHGD